MTEKGSGWTGSLDGFGRGRNKKGGGGPPIAPEKIVLLAGAGIVLALGIGFMASGRGGFVEVEDTQAVVIVNYLTGGQEVAITPGYQIFFPFIQQAFLFDKSPQEFLMSGDRDIDANHVSKLTVRANDGSNFWFEEIKIQYELIPDSAGIVLADSGPTENFKQNWVRAYARSVLRDEFGKFSAVDVADPTQYKVATVEVERRLNEDLQPHGVRIIQIITPRPKFEARYEKAIDDRKVANQEVEKLIARTDQLIQERRRRLAEIENLRTVDYEQLKGTLEAERVSAEKDRVRVERSADAYKAQKLGEGEAVKARMTEEARGLTEKARNEAEGLTAMVQALEVGGEVLVREQLAQMLMDIEFTLIPYSKDPAPSRVELLDEVTAATTARRGDNR